MDSRLAFHRHIIDVSQKVRKLSYVFRQLRHAVDSKVMRNIYLALCHSVLSYGSTIWGCAAKSHLIMLERAQRLILKVSHCKPRLYPTKQLYRECKILTVRQTYILATILRQHSLLNFSSEHPLANTRRHHAVCVVFSGSTKFCRKFFKYQGGRLYNMANKLLNVYSKTKFHCGTIVSDWLQKFDYTETEYILTK